MTADNIIAVTGATIPGIGSVTVPTGNTINYRYSEDTILEEIKSYIDATYGEHYASNDRIQVTEFIQSHCDSIDFLRGNAIKYVARYGRKAGYNRKDMLKAIHYCMLMMHFAPEDV